MIVINLNLVVAKMMKSRKSFKNIVRTVVNPKSTEAYENSIGRSQGCLIYLSFVYLFSLLFKSLCEERKCYYAKKITDSNFLI